MKQPIHLSKNNTAQFSFKDTQMIFEFFPVHWKFS